MSLKKSVMQYINEHNNSEKRKEKIKYSKNIENREYIQQYIC